MIIIVTDGDPDARNVTSGVESDYPHGSWQAMQAAFVQANEAKLNVVQTRIFAVGVGKALSDEGSLIRLQAISGPTEFTGTNSLSSSDYIRVPALASGQEALQQLADQLCAARMHVTDEVDEGNGAGFEAANGWDFTGTVSVGAADPLSFRWLTPGVEEGPPASSASRTAATSNVLGEDGRLDFAWAPSPVTLTSSFVLEERAARWLRPGREVTCDAGTPQVSVVGQVVRVALSGLLVNQDVGCRVRNRRERGEVTVAKLFSGTPSTLYLLLDGVRR